MGAVATDLSKRPEAVDAASTRLRLVHLLVGALFVLGAAAAALFSGPADIAPRAVFDVIAAKLPFLGIHPHTAAVTSAIVWQIRLPRIVLGALVGAMLALAGATYQGIFQNPLADPYLLGIAAGAGLGATLAVELVANPEAWPIDPVPLAAFCGAITAVCATFALGRAARTMRGPATLILSGVAVGAFFTAVQTFAQQRDAPALQQIYSWILGGFFTSNWQQVLLVLPYIGGAVLVLFCSRRLLDVMSVGDEEAATLGLSPQRVRLVTVAAATLGTAAAVSVSGLVGFVGIIVPHTIRLVLGPSYRRIIPLSILYGAGFLVLADLLARTVLAPSEIPLGVVTAFIGAPFFLIVLRRSGRTF